MKNIYRTFFVLVLFVFMLSTATAQTVETVMIGIKPLAIDTIYYDWLEIDGVRVGGKIPVSRTASCAGISKNNTLETPSFLVLDARASWRFRKFHTLSVVANNLINANYFTEGYVVGGMPYYYVNMPVNWMSTLQLKF